MDSPHRLAAQVSMAAAEAAEQARCDAASPVGDGDAGTPLDGAGPGDFDVLGMSGDTSVPDASELAQAPLSGAADRRLLSAEEAST